MVTEKRGYLFLAFFGHEIEAGAQELGGVGKKRMCHGWTKSSII
jgi:hypothetical protein